MTISDTDETIRKDHASRGMLLAWWAARQPDIAAVTTDQAELTFGRLNIRANQLVRALRRMGVEPGDGVALACTNRSEFVEVVAACQRGGYRLTTVNWHLTADEAGYIVDDCRARALIADSALAPMASGAFRKAPACTVGLAVGDAIDGFAPYDDAVSAEDGSDIDDPELGSSMLYTSGTTGRPKGVYRNDTPASAATSLNLFGYRGGHEDRHLCTGPLYHAAPLAFSLTVPLAFGVGVVVMDRWDAADALALIDAHRITHTHMVPTMFHRLLALPEEVRSGYDTTSLRSVLHGAAPCPVPVKQRIIDWFGPVVTEYYAATEGVGCFVDSTTWLDRPGTVGRPMDGQVIVGDEAGDPLPAGETGLVYLKAPRVGRFEYFGDADKTDATYRGEYFTLGDIGRMDADGYLFLTDRSSNLIISGGVNIYPAEVDAVLLEHPGVGDAATIGVPDEEWGERVVAVIEPRAGVSPNSGLADDLIAFCRDRLASYKCPRTVEFVDELPRHDNGKIYKRRLRERFAAEV